MMNFEDSTNTVSINTWGPSLWSALHSLSLTYPTAVQTDDPKRVSMFKFLEALKVLIPCEECRAHYVEWFETVFEKGKNSDALLSRATLSKVIFEFHNEVNLRTNKPLFTDGELDKKYLNSSTKCPSNEAKWSISLIIIAVILLVVAAVLGYFAYTRKMF